MHCGFEYEPDVEPALKKLAHQIAAAGADAIVCAHPHVVRPWEWIETGGRRVFVHYSLGNLLSSHANSRYNEGELVFLTFAQREQGYHLKDARIVKIKTKYCAEKRKYVIAKL